MSTPSVRPGNPANQRRSQRVLLSVALHVSGTTLHDERFSERTSTVVVSAHGAMLLLRERVQTGRRLTLHNIGTNEEISCTVVDINAGVNGLAEVGVEFLQPCPRFWRVTFPPADWSPRSPEAKRFATSRLSREPQVHKK